MFAHGKEDLAMFVNVQVTSQIRFLMALKYWLETRYPSISGKQPGKLHYRLVYKTLKLQKFAFVLMKK